MPEDGLELTSASGKQTVKWSAFSQALCSGNPISTKGLSLVITRLNNNRRKESHSDKKAYIIFQSSETCSCCGEGDTYLRGIFDFLYMGRQKLCLFTRTCLPSS
jgi:hypothetical protein